MRKGIKILGKVFSAAVLLLIIVPVALSLLLDIPAVQNYAVHRAARFVSRKLETTVSIDRVDIGIFSKVRVKGFYVEDYQRDTLLYVGKLDAFITSFGIFGGGLELSRGEIADARLYLRQTPGGEMNIKQIVDRISDPDKPKKGNFRLSLKKASIENMDLCLERLDHRDPEHGIDFSHMHLYGITAHVSDFTIDGQSIYTTIEAMSARERSGFVLDHFSGRFYLTNGALGFEDTSARRRFVGRLQGFPGRGAPRRQTAQQHRLHGRHRLFRPAAPRVAYRFQQYRHRGRGRRLRFHGQGQEPAGG